MSGEKYYHKLVAPGPVIAASSLSTFSDAALEASLMALVQEERERTADVVEHLMEVDDRKSYQQRGYMTLFDYCHFFLRYSEDAAFKRMRAARAAKIAPSALALLRRGKFSLATLVVLHPHLKRENSEEILIASIGLSRRRTEQLVADRFGIQLPQRDHIRPGAVPAENKNHQVAEEGSLPLAASGDSVKAGEELNASAFSKPSTRPPAAAAPPKAMEYRFAFTGDAEFRQLVYRAQALLRHKFPDGRLGGVLKDALKVLIAKRDPIYRAELARKRDRETLARAGRTPL